MCHAGGDGVDYRRGDQVLHGELIPQFCERTDKYGNTMRYGELGLDQLIRPVVGSFTANSPAAQAGHPANWQAVLWHEFCHVVTLQKFPFDRFNRFNRETYVYPFRHYCSTVESQRSAASTKEPLAVT